MKTTCRKSWPGNLFQVLNLTFDPCFKVKWGRHIKTSLFLSYFWCYGFRLYRQTMKNIGCGREIVNAFHTRVCLCIRPCICLSGFNIHLNISFIYKDIFIKLAGNVYGYKNLSLQNFGRHSQLFKNHKVFLNLEIFQLASSYLHKRYMARKASLIVILTLFYKENGRHITCLMSNGVILLKRPYISPNIALTFRM